MCGLNCKRDTEVVKPKFWRISNKWKMLLWKIAAYNSTTSKLIKKRKEIGLLSQLKIKSPLSKMPLLGDILI